MPTAAMAADAISVWRKPCKTLSDPLIQPRHSFLLRITRTHRQTAAGRHPAARAQINNPASIGMYSLWQSKCTPPAALECCERAVKGLRAAG